MAGVTSLQYSPIGDHLVLGMNDGNVVVLDGRADTFSVQHILEFSSQVSLLLQRLTKILEFPNVFRVMLRLQPLPFRRIAPCLLLARMMGS